MSASFSPSISRIGRSWANSAASDVQVPLLTKMAAFALSACITPKSSRTGCTLYAYASCYQCPEIVLLYEYTAMQIEYDTTSRRLNLSSHTHEPQEAAVSL